jgi:hypothetical protein
MKEMTCYAGPMVLPAMQVLLFRYSYLPGTEKRTCYASPMILSCYTGLDILVKLPIIYQDLYSRA